MKPVCTVCGRRTTPFVMLGTEPIGPKCAAKMGLTPGKVGKSSRVRFTKLKPQRRPSGPETGDLFEGME